ncbi:MAG: 50S ribosomal protein L35 [Desulfotomaculum sp.]|nr:50S ribosomal protein L35 [Desulfotomaculum sp.]
MPKMKTHKGAAKRFKRTGSGKIKRSSAFKSHLLGKKSAKCKRNMRKGMLVSGADYQRITKLLP